MNLPRVHLPSPPFLAPGYLVGPKCIQIKPLWYGVWGHSFTLQPSLPTCPDWAQLKGYHHLLNPFPPFPFQGGLCQECCPSESPTLNTSHVSATIWRAQPPQGLSEPSVDSLFSLFWLPFSRKCPSYAPEVGNISSAKVWLSSWIMCWVLPVYLLSPYLGLKF